jgi:CHASE3 domain sensor protein
MSMDMETRLKQAEASADRAARLARVALIIACISVALAVLGIFLPIDL